MLTNKQRISLSKRHYLQSTSLPGFIGDRGKFHKFYEILESVHLCYPAIEEHRPDFMMVAHLTILIHLEAIFARYILKCVTYYCESRMSDLVSSKYCLLFWHLRV